MAISVVLGTVHEYLELNPETNQIIHQKEAASLETTLEASTCH